MEGQVSEEKNKERMARLIKLSEECTLKANSIYLDKTYPVLVEGISKRDKDMVSGRTDHGRMVSFLGTEELLGKTVNVKITKVKLNTLMGEMEE
jgi:tRNA-2-methylthio-N6-dimethylallyladenosine synthase